jgi:hypothetical protein
MPRGWDGDDDQESEGEWVDREVYSGVRSSENFSDYSGQQVFMSSRGGGEP